MSIRIMNANPALDAAISRNNHLAEFFRRYLAQCSIRLRFSQVKRLLRRSESEEKTGRQKRQGHHNHADLKKTPRADLKVLPSQGDEPQNRC
jgi:hypothetical protein